MQIRFVYDLRTSLYKYGHLIGTWILVEVGAD